VNVQKQTILTIFGCLLAVWLGGCAPEARFSACQCRRVEEGGRLQALTFVSTFEAHGLAGRQILYEVRLIGQDGEPIRSGDGRYQTAAGAVGAARSFIVHRDPQTFANTSVTIPADELEFRQEDIPVTAEVGVSLPGGVNVASQSCAVPVSRVEEIAPPLERPQPDRLAYWFIRPKPATEVPLLLGPYRSAKAASEARPRTRLRPRRIRASDYVWFVPLRRSSRPGGEQLIGPCDSERDARKVAKALDQAIKDRAVPFQTGPSVRLRLGTWLGKPSARDQRRPREAMLRTLRSLGIEPGAPQSQPSAAPPG